MYDIFALDKRTLKMAHAKFIWLIVDLFGGIFTFLGIVANLDNIKSGILFVLAVIYFMIRGYYYWKQKEQAVREKEIQLWHMEMDKQLRESKMSN